MNAQVWGTDVGSYDGLALVTADEVSRLLLPLHTGDRLRTWSELARSLGTDPVDGYVEWDAMTAWPGTGAGPSHLPERSVIPDLAWATRLGNALAPSSNLAHAMRRWADSGDPGRWTDGVVGLAGLPFADSVVISGPESTTDRLHRAGFEIYRVARSRSLPAWTD